MGASKKDFTELREADCFMGLEVSIAFYETNMDLFENNEDVRIKSAYRKFTPPKGDQEYKQKIDAFIEARNDLMEYQINKGYKEYLK